MQDIQVAPISISMFHLAARYSSLHFSKTRLHPIEHTYTHHDYVYAHARCVSIADSGQDDGSAECRPVTALCESCSRKKSSSFIANLSNGAL